MFSGKYFSYLQALIWGFLGSSNISVLFLYIHPHMPVLSVCLPVCPYQHLLAGSTYAAAAAAKKLL